MKRRIFLGAGLLGLTASVFPLLHLNANHKKTNNQPMDNIIQHQVYFWLKPGITELEEQDFLNFFKTLKTVPGIKSFVVGKPAPTNPRDVVDNSFSYSITVTFENMDAINVYETHPIHTQAAAKYAKYWTRVQVRDTQTFNL